MMKLNVKCKSPLLLIGHLLFLMSFSACEKVIDIDLNEAEPVLVIQAEIGGDRTTQAVVLQRSVAFSSAVTSEPVSGALITVKDERVADSSGNPINGNSLVRNATYTFREVTPGVYLLDNYRGYPGVKYTLNILLDDHQYEASSVMPPLVKIDSIGTTKSSIFGEDRNMVAVKYLDPEGVPNYYRYQLVHNGEWMNTILVRSDKFNDGRMVEQSLFDLDVDFNVGDHLEVIQQSVSKEVYDFFNAVLSNNPGSAAPANPPSMFGPGTIGYFSAYSADQAATLISN
ncbi:DUF4249 domain-containing protein [Olivibacter sitiensis]|uniref:DUF4249 domain-containing protein n=1 Tax=Olivibacter sitiensis TaxID=376470 RepID=UPI0004802267|nr:DUF4249 domain-containing protein [Olivibacter sitiensis]